MEVDYNEISYESSRFCNYLLLFGAGVVTSVPITALFDYMKDQKLDNPDTIIGLGALSILSFLGAGFFGARASYYKNKAERFKVLELDDRVSILSNNKSQ
jgi:hypothetical protein